MDAELLLRTANRSDITAGMRLQFINDAYMRVANEFDHRELQGFATEAVSATVQSHTPIVATDIWWPDLVRNATSSWLMDFEDRERIYGAALTTGQPRKYAWYGGVFYFDTITDVATSVQIWYTKQPAELSGTTTSVLNRIFDPLIVMFAAQIAFETVRDFAEAHIQEVTANNYVARQRLPLREAKKNDHRTGIRLRMR